MPGRVRSQTPCRANLKGEWTTNQSFLKVFAPFCGHVVIILASASPKQDDIAMTMLNHISHTAATVPIARKFAARLGNCINNWLAAWIARQEREAARKILLSFSDRQLRDIGLARSQIEYALKHAPSRD
jgi:uncharacterized protein YjiS (DUF1127 family)